MQMLNLIFTIFRLLGILWQVLMLHPRWSVDIVMWSEESNYFYFKGTSQMVAMVGDFYVWTWNLLFWDIKDGCICLYCHQSLVFSELCINQFQGRTSPRSNTRGIFWGSQKLCSRAKFSCKSTAPGGKKYPPPWSILEDIVSLSC